MSLILVWIWLTKIPFLTIIKQMFFVTAIISLVVTSIVMHIICKHAKLKSLISDAQYYILVKLCRITGSIHLFTISGKLAPEHTELKRNIIWDIIEIEWKEVSLTFNGNKVNLPNSVITPFRDKFKIRCIVRREPLLLHIMLKQGTMWFSVQNNNENTEGM